MKNKLNVAKHITPKVNLLHATPLFVGEVGGRNCYDSFNNSEHQSIVDYGKNRSLDNIEELNNIDSSKLLEKLSHVYHHSSVIEHITLNFEVTDVCRGVLMELSRHRIASYSVKSTRYTMSHIIMAFMYTTLDMSTNGKRMDEFFNYITKAKVLTFDPSSESELLRTNIKYMWEQLNTYIDRFYDVELLSKVTDLTYEQFAKMSSIEEAMTHLKIKKNMGDDFKHIVNDNWNTSLVMSFNLRSLQNFLNLRNSGAAYYLIQELAIEVENTIPLGHLKIIKKIKDK